MLLSYLDFASRAAGYEAELMLKMLFSLSPLESNIFCLKYLYVHSVTWAVGHSECLCDILVHQSVCECGNGASTPVYLSNGVMTARTALKSKASGPFGLE